MEVTNDNGCSWVNDLIPRTNIKTLQSNENSEWLVLVLGILVYLLLEISQLYPNQKLL